MSHDVLTVKRAHGQSWHDAVADAGEAEWLWLVEEGVAPEHGALGALEAVLDDLGDLPAPLLLTSKVLTGYGDLHLASEPVLPLLDRAVAVAAARRRVVSVRMARWGSLLVHRDAIARHGPPRADFAAGADDLEWTARILRDAPGYLVPRSVAHRAGPLRRPLHARNRLRMLRSDAWVAQEPVWWAFMLAVDLIPSRNPRATVASESRPKRLARR